MTLPFSTCLSEPPGSGMTPIRWTEKRWGGRQASDICRLSFQYIQTARTGGCDTHGEDVGLHARAGVPKPVGAATDSPPVGRVAGGAHRCIWTPAGRCLAARGQTSHGVRGALHPRWAAALCVAPRTNSAAAIGPSSRLASGSLRASRCSREIIHGPQVSPPDVQALRAW